MLFSDIPCVAIFVTDALTIEVPMYSSYPDLGQNRAKDVHW